jgi:indolepyruvate ferredoxin oxidoreductase beta subunit
MNADGNTRIYLCGVGGQGSVTASQWIGEAAMAVDLEVTVSEVHGMSQRGGVVESAVLIGGAKSPLIGLGDADVLLAFEPLEALRALPYCSAKTTAIVNTRPIVPFTVSLGQAAYPDLTALLEQLARATRRVVAFDATAVAESAGSEKAINAVLLGALAASETTPLPADGLRDIVLKNSKAQFRDTNAKAFALGAQAVRDAAPAR